MYVQLTEICRANGYALAVHGSMARDFDLIAVPWVEAPSDPEVVVSLITNQLAVSRVGELGIKEHGRICYTLAMYGEFFFDFSFMPTVKAGAAC